jgi:ATP-binding cassette subfamily B protein
MADAPADADAQEPELQSLSVGLRDARRTLGLVWTPCRGLIMLIGTLILAAALLPAAALFVSKLVVDGVVRAIDTQAATDREAALIWVGVEAGLLTLLLTARRLLAFYKSRLHAEMGFVVGVHILERVQAFSLRQVEDPEIQQQVVMARQFAASRPYSLVNRVFDIIQQGLTLGALAGLLIGFSPVLLLLVVAGGVPLFIGNLKFSGAAYRFYTSRTPQTRERSYLESLITNEGSARERLHFGIGPAILRRYHTLFDALYSGDRSLQFRRAWFGAALGIVSSAVFLVGKLWIVWVTIAGTITLGQMTMFVGLLKQGQNNLTNLLAAFNGIVEDLLYVANLYALLDLPAEGDEGQAVSGPTPGDGLRFEGVCFTYPGRETAALQDVSFHLAPGSSLGLVGANGSGKTTLVKLAAGLYRPDEGRVCLDGLDLRDWSREALSSRISAMFQPHVNYKLSARDNIAVGIGLAAVGDADLERAAGQGLADELLASLPMGLETRLSKRFLDGTELSGGQWQRLAMARAYLNENADILILDEPTAAMDPAAEAEFMDRPRGNRSVILISHRLANIRRADQILLLDGGRLVETGDHASLIAQGGQYATLFASQANPYREA